MQITVKAVDFSLDKKQQELVDKKLKRISYAEELITDLSISIKHERDYKVDATFNFKWGNSSHVSGEGKEFQEALNIMMDILDNKVKKEKDKYQEKV